ncbi:MULTISPECIES: acetoacetyl-CoA reductase [Ectothiorhodospira]|uniref:3-oxoacyl-[acyl-carrier-protein] reductase n=1 Tax=Ectothiorhodospira marina TaxID=1396821 RepID=A0A1H7LGG6_9GAMM|nr:acetoacetyl-CoA reductase [Ectothiorhodospira marina]MCG5516343.1 acetoacetyl-CoA reductase [Ectothiorhodospira sp. 9100]MCG5518405.1 acetoacetyl-CoA reductase [Ectothiorhodospira sp. 9905]SEK97950.1 3-oxoacyl-[acyl-carrier-protein] reductase [Ectothiorhodospira marina]
MSKRVALVTGGTGGIGGEICKKLAQQGHKVVANYLPALKDEAEAWQKQMKDEGFEMDIASGDVSSFESCAEMVKDVESRVGPIDILVNCAGITRDKTLRKMEEKQWTDVININLNSVFNTTRQVVEGMTSRGFGRIVNISSVNGQKGQFGQANYSAAKAGMHGFTMAVAQETAAKGVTVNTVSPGYTATAMTEAMPEDVRNAIVAQVPAGRMGSTKDIAFAVAMLCDEDAGYITGANLPVNGGLFTSF